MTQSNTPEAKSDLSSHQVIAVKELMAGKTVTEAAKSANVSRETVHRWQREDWNFQAALNKAKREVLDAVTMRITALADEAVDTVAKTLEKGDTRTALEILKGLGMLRGERIHIGPTDPKLLKKDAEIHESELQADFSHRELIAGLKAG